MAPKEKRRKMVIDEIERVQIQINKAAKAGTLNKAKFLDITEYLRALQRRVK